MPTISNTNFARVGGGDPVVSFDVAWSALERVTPYIMRFEFWEQDSGARGGDDFVNHIVDTPLDATPTRPRPPNENIALAVAPSPNWNQEWGKDEIYAVIRLFPRPDAEVARPARSRTNAISERF